MKSMSRVVLVVAMVAGLLSAAVSAGAQEEGASGYLAAVNGASTAPVDVTAGGELIYSGLGYAGDGAAVILAPNSYDVLFRGGTVDSGVTVAVTGGSAQTAVSALGNAPTAAYPVDVAPIAAGEAKFAIWNTTDAAVQVDPGTGTPETVQPGAGIGPFAVAADTSVTVTIDAESRTIQTPADSYTDVFAVNDGVAPEIAISVIGSMAALIEALAAPPAPETVPVPDVAGQTAADGQAAIDSVGLVAAAEDQDSTDVEAGLVIETNPAAGTEVALGSTVIMMVSTGPATIPVPDVSGQAAADAQASLEAEGFVVTSTEAASDDVEAGLVISTNPAAGTEVAPGTTVDMSVSTGPEDVEVPRFIGLTTDEATELAEEVGLIVTFVEDPNRPDPNGIVVDQDPDPGAMVEPGSEVTALLSPLADAPYVVINLDTNRLMTTTGLNFLPGSTTTLTVVGTDLGATIPVDETGVWWETFQLGDAQTEVETLLVEGTSATGSPFRATFEIPPADGSTDVAVESTEDSSSGMPWWGWALIALAAVGIGVLVWWLVAGRDSETVTTSSGDGQAPPPPPPAAGA